MTELEPHDLPDINTGSRWQNWQNFQKYQSKMYPSVVLNVIVAMIIVGIVMVPVLNYVSAGKAGADLIVSGLAVFGVVIGPLILLLIFIHSIRKYFKKRNTHETTN